MQVYLGLLSFNVKTRKLVHVLRARLLFDEMGEYVISQ